MADNGDLRKALVRTRSKPLRAALESAQGRANRRTVAILQWQGPWDPDRRYRVGDVVEDHGSSWRCLVATTGNPPPLLPAESNQWWELVAAKGDPGAIGARGFIGPTGPQGPPGGNLAFEDEGVPLGTAPTVDFVGAGVTASIAAGVATVTIPGGSSFGSPVAVGLANADGVSPDTVHADHVHEHPVFAGGDLHPEYTTPAEAAAAAPVQSVFGRTGAVTALAADYDAFFLTPAEGDVAYIAKAFLDAKGDLISASADNTPVRLAVGADDTILMADAATASGLKWIASATPVNQAFGDVAAIGTGDTFSRGDHKHGMPSAASVSALAPVQSVFGRTGAVTALAADYDAFFLTPAEGDAAYIAKAFFDAKGDLLSASADNIPVRLAVGANDTILMADSGQTSGLKWVGPATPSTQAFGDVATEGTGDTFTRGDHKHGMPSSASVAALAPVQSVFGRTGAVTALQADYDAFFLTPTEGDAAYLAKGSLTDGSVLFASGGQVAQDNTNFFWDDTNNRLRFNDVELFRSSAGVLRVYPTATDQLASLQYSPKGSPTNFGATFVLARTDVVADAVNFEYLQAYAARGTPGTGFIADAFGIVSAKGGTGVLRPIVMGMLSGTTFTEAARVETDGDVLISQGLVLVDVKASRPSAGAVRLRPETATQSHQLQLSPNGSPTNFGGFLQIFRTDIAADGTNFEGFTLFTTRGTPGIGLTADSYIIAARKAGTGTLRPMILGMHSDSTFTEALRILTDANLQVADGRTVALGTGTGTKWGTATNQKQAWFNATPVVQATGIADADGTLADVTTKFNSLVAKLETYGLLAAA